MNYINKTTGNIAFVAVLGVLCTACAIEPVKPWEKGTLAEETMRFGGPNPMIKKFDEHIFTSKESTKGGGGVSGGGCGCN